MAFLLDVFGTSNYYLHQLVGLWYAELQFIFFDLSYKIDSWYELLYVGNYSLNQLTSYDGYIVTILPAVNYLAMFIFYLIWKAHFYKSISNQEEDNSNVKP